MSIYIKFWIFPHQILLQQKSFFVLVRSNKIKQILNLTFLNEEKNFHKKFNNNKTTHIRLKSYKKYL